MSTNFKPETFFDLSEVNFADLFTDLTYAWEALAKLHYYIMAQFSTGRIVSNYGKNGDIFIGEGTVIEEGAKIVGPAIIGKNCFIGHATFLRNDCLLGDNINIGHATELKHAIILNHTAAAHLNYIGDSIIGNNVNVSGGAIFANYRFDKQPVAVRVGDEKMQTGLKKFSSIVGDGSNIGVNAMLNPGTILGKNTLVYPLTAVKGIHETGEVIKK